MLNDEAGHDPEDFSPESSPRRSNDEIRLRDYDRIQERKPFALKPVHLKIAAVAGIALVCTAVVTGWVLGRSSRYGDATGNAGHVALTTPAPVPDKSLDGARRDNGQTPTPTPGNVRGSILPLPSPLPRPAVEARMERRGIVPVVEPVKPPEPEFADWTFWPPLLVTTCGYSCISPDGDCVFEDRPKPPPVVAAEPAAAESTAAEPVVAEPVATEPMTTQAVATEAVATKPVATEAVATQPVAVQPVAGQPVAAARSPDDSTAGKPARAQTAPRQGQAGAAAQTGAVRQERPARTVETPPRHFAVQIRSFREEPIAKEFADQIRAKGYNPFIVSFTDASGVTWYRVRTGSFETAADATAYAADLNTRESEQSIPVEVK